MLKPLIILENFLDGSSRNFLINYVKFLKEIGYKKFLYEMNSEISIRQLKAECQLISKSPKIEDKLKISHLNTLTLITTLEKEGFEIEFIDPQTRQGAIADTTKFLKKFDEVTNDLEVEAIMLERKEMTRERDEIMSPKIYQEAVSNNGGIIFMGGFMHRHLLKQLNKLKSDEFNPHFLIFSNAKNMCTKNSEYDDLEWLNILDHNYRKNFYGFKINFIEHQAKYSFAMLENVLSLTKKSPIDFSSYLGDTINSHFNNKPFIFELDAQHILSAFAVFQDKNDARTFSNEIDKKNLGFFHLRTLKNNLSAVEIYGLNLPENISKFNLKNK